MMLAKLLAISVSQDLLGTLLEGVMGLANPERACMHPIHKLTISFNDKRAYLVCYHLNVLKLFCVSRVVIVLKGDTALSVFFLQP